MKYSLRSLLLAATFGPLVLALFLLGWRQTVPRETRMWVNIAGICVLGLNSAAVFVLHRRSADASVLAYGCLHLLPLTALVIDLFAP